MLNDETFLKAQLFVSKWEGGLSDHKADSGGLTNYGVSLRFLRATGHDVDRDGDVDADDIRVLTPAGAADLLKQEFWTCQDLDTFPPITAVAHYDASVNCGRGRAVWLLQAACNSFQGPQIKEDGRLGPKTRARVADLLDSDLARKCVAVRQDFYKRLAVEKPNLACFLSGWLNRSNDLLKYVSKLAGIETQPEKVRTDETKDQGLVATLAESPAPILPTLRPGVANPQSPLVLPPVSSTVSPFSGLMPVLKKLSTSKTMGGIAGMLAMQLFGFDNWDLSIVSHGVTYTVSDLSPYINTALAALATWGRITAKPIKDGAK